MKGCMKFLPLELYLIRPPMDTDKLTYTHAIAKFSITCLLRRDGSGTGDRAERKSNAISQWKTKYFGTIHTPS